MKNFLRLDGRSILSVPYMYIDHKDYLADSLLTQNHVSVRFGSEFSRDNSPYHIIICKVRKKDTAEFEKSMELLCNKMLLFGHNDYTEFCNSIMETLEQNRGAACRNHLFRSANRVRKHKRHTIPHSVLPGEF